MITLDGKRVKYSNVIEKQKAEKLKVAVAKHAGKIIRDLTARQQEDLLMALCDRFGLVDENGVIR